VGGGSTSRRGFLALGFFPALVAGGGAEAGEARGRRIARERPAAAKPPRVRTRSVAHADRRRRAAPRPLVVVDPGHGGRDPGAVGARGTLEKTVVLAVARELRRALLATGRYRVALTREGDATLPPRTRAAFARRRRAALLVSLHADSAPGARGASAYTLPVAGPGPAASAVGGPSARLARLALAEVGRVAALLDDPHREAGLAVLRASGVPAVLVELGFLSHPGDEALLRRASHRRGLARAMARAVDGWFAGADRPLLATADAG
jgi:N-acetylmuramoyl-L-alanine amidase